MGLSEGDGVVIIQVLRVDLPDSRSVRATRRLLRQQETVIIDVIYHENASDQQLEPGADLTGGHLCSGRRGPCTVEPPEAPEMTSKINNTRDKNYSCSLQTAIKVH